MSVAASCWSPWGEPKGNLQPRRDPARRTNHTCCRADNTWRHTNITRRTRTSPGAHEHHPAPRNQPISAGLAPVGITTGQLPAGSDMAFALHPGSSGGKQRLFGEPRGPRARLAPFRIWSLTARAGRPPGCKTGLDWCRNRAFECIPAVVFVHFSVRFGAGFVIVAGAMACSEDFTRPTGLRLLLELAL